MGPRARRSGFLIKDVGDQLVMFDQSGQRLHVLSRTSALVWRLCDGKRTVADLVELVGAEFGAPVNESLITLALEQLDEAHLLERPFAAATGDGGLSRRDLLHRAAAVAAGIMLPTITSCGMPTEPTDFNGASLGIEPNPTTTSTSPAGTTTSTTPAGTTTTTTPAGTTTTTTSTTPAGTTTTTSTTPTGTTTTTTSTTTSTTPAPKKVAMCHKGRTVMVDDASVPTHLAHGDTIGPCPP
jgi:hypothetical protein